MSTLSSKNKVIGKPAVRFMPVIQGLLKRIKYSFYRLPHVYALLFCLVYLLIFQWNFVSTGDAWAEAFYEYVHGAVANGVHGFFTTGIAGYYNFLPKLLSFPYVILGLPLNHIDQFFRLGVIAFAVASISFIAHPYNRPVIKSDLLRVLLSLCTLMTIGHISSFSMINIWYVGFIPIILISLSPNRFKNEFSQIIYAAFGMAVCLSKPSIVLLPLVLYRAWRHKEYLLGSILTFAIGLQTLLFFSSTFYSSSPPAAHVGILSKLSDILLYPGVILLKIVHIYPANLLYVVLSTAVLILFSLYAYKKLGLVRISVLLAFTFGLIYTSVFPPDSPLPRVLSSYKYIYLDHTKLQRDIVLSFLLVLSLMFFIEFMMNNATRLARYQRYTLISLLLLFVISLYRPIDVSSSNLYVSIDSFRSDLHARSATCMPIAPTPTWVPVNAKPGPTYGWYYEADALGSCSKLNYEKTLDPVNYIKSPAVSPYMIDVGPNGKIRSLLIPVRTNHAQDTVDFTLTNIDSKKVFRFKVKGRQTDRNAFASFNLGGESQQAVYRYKLSASSQYEIERFTDGTQAFFAYYLVQ